MRRSTRTTWGAAAARSPLSPEVAQRQAGRSGDQHAEGASTPTEAGLDNLLSASRVSEILDVTTRTLRRYARAGTLVPVRFGGVVRYRERDLLAFLNAAESET